MKIPANKWFKAIRVRRSRRKYNGEALSAELVQQLTEFSQELSGHIEGVRVALVTENPDKVFKGIIGSYGKISAAPAYVAFIADTRTLDAEAKVGYIGECFILEATSLELATCWVGGMFKRDVVKKQIDLRPNEKVYAISPVGYVEGDQTLEEKLMSGFATSHKRKRLEALLRGADEHYWPEWTRSALEAARLAPSAMNRQPWRFTVEEGSIKVSVDSANFNIGLSKRLDCGIAMLHLEVGFLAKGVRGNWKYLASPDVAVFQIEH